MNGILSPKGPAALAAVEATPVAHRAPAPLPVQDLALSPLVPLQRDALTALPATGITSEADVRRLARWIAQLPYKQVLAAQQALQGPYDLRPYVEVEAGQHRLTDSPKLWLRLSEGLERLEVRLLERELCEDELNGHYRLTESDGRTLCSIPNPTLIHSFRAIEQHCALEHRDLVHTLNSRSKVRLLSYGCHSVTWHSELDRNVLAFSIDTANIIQAMAMGGLLASPWVERFVELGVGSGAIAKNAALKLPNAREIVITDINAYALLCARRNIEPFLRPSQTLEAYLGNGLGHLCGVDLLAVNPPYIPHPKGYDARDPYCGTGLIAEVFDAGARILNARNPEACIVMGASSLTEKDVRRYAARNPDLVLELIGKRRRVPLKVFAINSDTSWTSWLEREHGLIRDHERCRHEGHLFWHDIFTMRIRRATSATLPRPPSPEKHLPA